MACSGTALLFTLLLKHVVGKLVVVMWVKLNWPKVGQMVGFYFICVEIMGFDDR
jgi:hypothetical protein